MSKPLALLYYENLLPGSQLANRLQDMGYRVRVLTEVEKLAEVCEAEKPLVALVEITADAPAYEWIGQLKKNPATRHVPVLAYSGVHDAAQQAAAKQAGVALLAGNTAISEQLPQLLDQVLEVE